MKRLFKRLPALAADYSGAFSVLFEMDCLKILHGQGGCTGNYCYADEFRWMDKKKNVFHSNMSEIEAIVGDDSIVINKAVQAQRDLECGFIAICSSPIPTVLGTDIRAIARIIEKKAGCPVLGLDTHGLGRYDDGQKMAYEALMKRFALQDTNQDVTEDGTRKIVNVIGATPLDGWSQEMADDLTSVLMNQGYQRIHIWGMGADIQEIAVSRYASLNIAVSVSGLSTVRKLEQEFGTPYATGFVIGSGEEVPEDKMIGCGKRVCVLAEQFTGNAIRVCLREQFGVEDVDVMSFFAMDEEYMEAGDVHVHYEEDLEKLIEERMPYDAVIGDAFIRRFFREEQPYIVIPHPAVCAHNNTPYVTEFSYQPHLAMVVGDYNTVPFVNLIGKKGYDFLKTRLYELWEA